MSGTFRSWRLGSPGNSTIRGGCYGPKEWRVHKNPTPPVRTQCPPAGKDQIGSAYNESTSIGMTVSSRSLCCGFLTDTVMVLTISCTRRTELKRRSARPGVHFRRPQQLPSQVVHIKKQNRLRIYAAKLLPYTLFPAFGEIRLGVHVLGEETILVRHPKKSSTAAIMSRCETRWPAPDPRRNPRPPRKCAPTVSAPLCADFRCLLWLGAREP